MKKSKCKYIFDKSKLGEKLDLVYCGKQTKNKKIFCDLHQPEIINLRKQLNVSSN